MAQSNQPMTTDRALLVSRVLFKSILSGLLVFACVSLYLMKFQDWQRDKSLSTIFTIVSSAMLVAGGAAGYFLRDRIWYGNNRINTKVAPADYVKGNLVFWILLDGAAIAGIAGVLVTGSMLPSLIPAVVAMALIGMSFPTGQQMK